MSAKTTSLLLLCVLGMAAQEPLSAPDTPISVCEALRKLRDLNGKVVSIRAQVVATDELYYLIGTACEKPLVTDGYTWKNPAGIALLPDKLPAQVKPEDLVVLNPEQPTDSDVIIATFTGRFESRERYEVVALANGVRIPYGYGHMGGFPAQLVIKEIRDAKSERRKPKPKSP